MRRMYGLIGVLAMVATPAAAAILFGWELYEYLANRQVPLLLAIVGGVGGALAMESAGVYAGHIGIEAWQRGHRPALVIALVAMAVYVFFGWSTLAVYGFVFLLAALIYALIAVGQSLRQQDDAVAEERAEERAFERRMAEREAEMKHAERLERIRHKAARPQRQNTRQDARQDAGNLPDDWRQLTEAQKREIARLTPEELANLKPHLSDRTLRGWRERAAQYSGEFSANGHVNGVAK